MEKRQRRSRNRVTLNDVARRARVSPMTVSRTFNAPDQVSPDLREAVLRAVNDLGYIQNRLAGALASNRSGVVAIVIPSLTNNVFIAMTNAIHKVLVGQGVQPLITVTDYSFEKERTAISNILAWSPDGLVLVGIDHAPDLHRLIENSGIPVVETVQVGEGAIDMNVGIDQYRAGYAMGEHLVSRGYRSVWMLGAELEADRRVSQRFKGCCAALAKAGLRTDLVRQFPSEDNLSFGRQTFAMVAEARHEKSAIFYGNDLMAIGAFQGAKDMGLSVPGDIGIAGFNGIDLSAYVDPKLTTMAVPYVEMGRLAAEMLLADIKGMERPSPRVVELLPTLIAGEST
jgi:LacI family gluconate utilization system Gnt-I transcriptional repressor